VPVNLLKINYLIVSMLQKPLILIADCGFAIAELKNPKSKIENPKSNWEGSGKR
jgi:hypothetical protein